MRSFLPVLLLAFVHLASCSQGRSDGQTDDLPEPADSMEVATTEDVASEGVVFLDSAGDALDIVPEVVPVDALLEVVDMDPRQALREQSLYANISFEEADSKGMPIGWSCAWFGDGPEPPTLCEVVSGNAVHGEFMLRIVPGAVVYQDEAKLQQTASVRFDLFARVGHAAPQPAAFYQFGMEKNAQMPLWVQYAKQVQPAQSGWFLAAAMPQLLDGVDQLRLCLSNVDGDEDLYVDDLVVLEEEEPMLPSAHLLRTEHFGKFNVTAGAEDAVLWIPLPIDHGHQVPLYIGLEVDPEGLAESIDYSLDEHGNLGAEVRFGPDTAAVGAVLRYEAVVLVLDGVPGADGLSTSAGLWLADTPVVHWGHEGLSAAAKEAVSGLAEPLQIMAALLGLSSQAISLEGVAEGLDAVSAFESHMGSCTAFANLGAALGRAVGMPTRTVANYLVGMPQQTHSLNEFYLGPDLGWRLVEPQSPTLSVPADYAVLVRIDLPDPDEGEAAMALSPWAYPGVPLLSLVRPLDGAGRLQPVMLTDHFPGCSSCDNMASYQAALFGDDAAMIFAEARNAWQQTLDGWVVTGVGPDEQVVRSKFLHAFTLEDVNTILDSVNTLSQ